MEAVIIVVISLCLTIALAIFVLYDRKQRLNLLVENQKNSETLKEFLKEIVTLQEELGKEREKNKTLLSQKKSSETRLGQISEHLVPFLENCPHNPKDLHFLGNPIDYVAFDLDEGKITFIEVKSGNSKPSKRQKVIKNLIKTGRVYYDEIRINEKGIRHKKIENEDSPVEVKDDTEN